MDTSEEAFDLERSRASFKLFPRPLHVLQKRTFRANGAQYEWVCDADADPDLRVLYLHGGGYISGDLDTTEPFSKLISHVTGCSVLAIEYRLAPEHPFPRALQDSFNAFKWLLSNGPQGRGTARKRFIAGDSSAWLLAAAPIGRRPG